MGPTVLLCLVFGILVLPAVAFAAMPILRAPALRLPVRLFLSGAAFAAILGIGGGLYLVAGSPALALRSLAPPADVPSLIAALSRRARQKSFDVTGWILLGRGYMALGDPGDSAAAYRRAVDAAPLRNRPGLWSAYGEALTMASSGTVTPEAETAFRAALAGNPKDFAARYYMGVADAARGDNAGAAGLWKGLLADAPPGAPWRGPLLDRIAALGMAGGQAPDIARMVAGLAARLNASPDDPEGWQRLVRAYAVLGERREAQAALGHARFALRGHANALAVLKAEAVSLKLE